MKGYDRSVAIEHIVRFYGKSDDFKSFISDQMEVDTTFDFSRELRDLSDREIQSLMIIMVEFFVNWEADGRA